MLTSLPELDRLILLDLDVKNIWSYSQVCKESASLCDNSLWRDLVRRDLNVKRQHGPYNEQYHYIMTTSLYQVLEDGRLDALEYIHQHDPVCEYEAMKSCEYGHLDMLKWVVQQGVKVTADCFEQAIWNDHHEIFEYLLSIAPHPLKFWRGPTSVAMIERLIGL